jgi:death-on-curing protein
VTEYLDLDDLLAAADAAVGGQADVRDVGLLQAAVARPQATAFGEEAYKTLDQKAGALLQSIVAGHPLVDGNKRLGWIAIRLFYRLNDADIQPTPDDAFDMVVSVAGGDRRDVGEIAATFARWRTSTEARSGGIDGGL